MDVISLAVQNAFEKVPHERLLPKVQALGMGIKWHIGISHGLVTGNKKGLLIENVLVGQKLLSRNVPGLGPGN